MTFMCKENKIIHLIMLLIVVTKLHNYVGLFKTLKHRIHQHSLSNCVSTKPFLGL